MLFGGKFCNMFCIMWCMILLLCVCGRLGMRCMMFGWNGLFSVVLIWLVSEVVSVFGGLLWVLV